MPLGFYIIMAAQFFSALADNALVVVAIAILRGMHAPEAYEPLLKAFFAISYVALAAHVGAFADFLPKGKVMLIGNSIKIIGCLMLLFYAHPLLAYGVVGLGAAVYSPAKYGILTEYLPHHRLVVANGWIEGLTIAAIILGFSLGGFLISPSLMSDSFSELAINSFYSGSFTVFSAPLLIDVAADPSVFEHISEARLTPEILGLLPIHFAIVLTCVLYVLAALFNLYVPNTGAPLKPFHHNPFKLFVEFAGCISLLWRDKLGQISLAVTTLFWGAGAALQFIVIKWADAALGLGLSQSTHLQGAVALGVAVGAAAAAKRVPLKKSITVIPLGIVMGFIVILMNFAHSPYLAVPLLICIGACSGYFVVPMNALLQHRGHILMGAGHSIAVQNFNENLSILALTGIYYWMLTMDLSIYVIISLFGLFVSGAMILIKRHHEANQRENDNLAYLNDCTKH